MGGSNSTQAQPVISETTVAANKTAQTTGEKPKCKACCACPETKLARDKCIMENGELNCKELIEAHKECMRKMGFNI